MSQFRCFLLSAVQFILVLPSLSIVVWQCPLWGPIRRRKDKVPLQSSLLSLSLPPSLPPSHQPNPSADSSADIYENLSSKELTPLPRSKTSTDKPPVPPPKNNSGYENTHPGNKPSGNGAFSRETPVVMPKPKNKSLQGDRLGEEEGNGDGSSGELYKTPSKSSLTPAPAPKPKPRRSVDSDSSLQETHTVPLVGTASLAPLKELPPTPQKVLPPTPQKALPPTPQKALPPTPQKELPPTPQKALPPTPQKVLPLTPQKERPLTPQRERPLNSQERPLTPQRERPLNSQERPLTPQREPPLNSQKGREELEVIVWVTHSPHHIGL